MASKTKVFLSFHAFHKDVEMFGGAMLHRLNSEDYEQWKSQGWSYDQMITDISHALYRVKSELDRGEFSDRHAIRCKLADSANVLMKAFKEFEGK